MSDPVPLGIYASFAATLEKTEWRPHLEIDLYRDALLRKLVSFAHAASPFHRERLKPLFRKGGEPDLSAWEEVPIMRRHDLDTAIDRINSVALPPEAGSAIERQTSGSTGARTKFRTCTLSLVAAECMMHRLYRWHGFDLASPLASIRYYSLGRRILPEGQTDARWSFIGPPAPHYTLDLRHDTGELIEWLARRRPAYLLTFPSVAHDIAMHANAGLVAALGLKHIVGISEVVTEQIRHAVRERLGCEIAQIYACSEMGAIALQSPADDQYLVCEESVFVELVNDDGEAIGPGETGRVVLTSIYNYATPFIRYEIGDYATWSEQECPSGRTLLRLRRIDGRARNALLGAHGRRVWPHQLPAADLARALASQQFQIVQEGDAVEVRYVAAPGGAAPDTEAVGTILSGTLERPLSVTTRAIDAIARTSGGKRELIVASA